MFAGLLFLWRVILITTFALTTNLGEYFYLMQVALLALFTIHAVARPYKRKMYNIIDTLLFANMAIINAIAWFTFYWTSKVAIAFQIVLMYFPFVCFAIFGILMLLQRLGIHVHWPNISEEESSVARAHRNSNKQRRKEQDNDADDDLFSRAAEQNCPPLVLTGSEAGFELRSQEATLTTEDK